MSIWFHISVKDCKRFYISDTPVRDTVIFIWLLLVRYTLSAVVHIWSLMTFMAVALWMICAEFLSLHRGHGVDSTSPNYDDWAPRCSGSEVGCWLSWSHGHWAQFGLGIQRLQRLQRVASWCSKFLIRNQWTQCTKIVHFSLFFPHCVFADFAVLREAPTFVKARPWRLRTCEIFGAS